MSAKAETQKIEKKLIKNIKTIKTTDATKEKKGKTDKKTNNVFKVIGSYRKGKVVQKFTKEILTPNKQQAEEYVYSILGSKHRLKRREITIDSIEHITADQVTDTIIKQMLEAK